MVCLNITEQFQKAMQEELGRISAKGGNSTESFQFDLNECASLARWQSYFGRLLFGFPHI